MSCRPDNQDKRKRKGAAIRRKQYSFLTRKQTRRARINIEKFIVIHIERGNIMRDKYEVGQAGAVGPDSHAHDMTFTQVWHQAESQIDLAQLVNELSTLRSKLKEEATEPEHDSAIGEVASAEISAKEGDGPTTLEHLAKAGKWVLAVAKKIGVPIAVAALKAALGL